ncbi:hypothetical protein AZF69_23065 [Salmonella enterica]|nr:hypothetical protein [Salmonella enterica]EBQ1580721.1 hypothetical protein [Salmonella enterica]
MISNFRCITFSFLIRERVYHLKVCLMSWVTATPTFHQEHFIFISLSVKPFVHSALLRAEPTEIVSLLISIPGH